MVKETDKDKSNGNLWEITTPEEVATSLLIFHPEDIWAELARREDYSRGQEQNENVRFWAEVRRLIQEQTGKGEPDE